MSEAGRIQVRGLSQTCNELEFGLSASSLAASYHELAGLRQVCDQPRTYICDQDSVMEFGLYKVIDTAVVCVCMIDGAPTPRASRQSHLSDLCAAPTHLRHDDRLIRQNWPTSAQSRLYDCPQPSADLPRTDPPNVHPSRTVMDCWGIRPGRLPSVVFRAGRRRPAEASRRSLARLK